MKASRAAAAQAQAAQQQADELAQLKEQLARIEAKLDQVLQSQATEIKGEDFGPEESKKLAEDLKKTKAKK